MRRLLRTCMIAAVAPCAAAQTTINGTSLVLKSSGATTGGTSWLMGSNGFVGTYINLASAGSVTLAVSAAGTLDLGVSPSMGIVVDDASIAFNVGAATATYSTTVNLPAGTHFVRTEFTNATTNRKLTIGNLQVTGATMSNSDTNANALAAANTYITNFRKGPANVSLTGPGNIPLLAGTSVPVNMVRNAFNFGGTVSGNSLGDSKDMLASNPAVGTEAKQFQQFINSYYNTIVPSNGGKWSNNEPTQGNVNMSLVDRQLNYAIAHNMRARMHNLIWGSGTLSGNQQPSWVNTLISSAAGGNAASKTSLRNAISSRINYYAGTTGNRSTKYFEMDVLNEALHNPSYWNIYNPATAGASSLSIASIYSEVLAAATAAGNPSLRLCLNEYNVLQFSPASIALGTGTLAGQYTGAQVGSDLYANWYRDEVEAVRNAGGAMGSIGMQEYVSLTQTGSNAHAASTIQKAIQNLSVEHLPLSLTEYGHASGTTSATSESLGPQAMDDAMRMFYGNPLGSAFMMWGWWDTSGNTPPAQMIITTPGNATYTLTQLGQKWVALMNEFSSHTTANVDANGAIQFNGFYGDYNIGSASVFSNMLLSKGTTQYALNLTAPPTWSLWNTANSGSWSTAGNWSSGGVANSVGQTAYFGPASAGRAINVDGAKTVGMIALDSTGKYTIGGSTISLDGLAGQAAIYVANGSHQIDAPLAPADDTTVTVAPAGSTLTITNLQNSNVNITKAGAGALVTNSIRAAGLNVSAGTLKIGANGTDAGASNVALFTIAGATDAWSATLDLADNAMAVRYSGVSPLATIQNQIKSGYASSTWSGMGITSSSAATITADGLNPHKTALGFAEASALGLSSFFGQPIAGNAVVIRYTFFGDANLDGAVNSLDFNSLATNFGVSASTWLNADFNYDGVVNSLDFDAISVNFNYTMPASVANFSSVVPEPVSALAIAPLSLIRRRRNHR